MVRSRSDRHPGPASARSHKTVSRGKVTRSWRCLFSARASRPVNRHKSTILFFVRVNQVLVRLWARAMEAGHCPVFVPLSG